MTSEELLRDRAAAYAEIAQDTVHGTQRCLEVTEKSKSWVFRESEIALVLPETKVTLLPPGARWGNWPCLGLICHALNTLPVLCWSEITGSPSSTDRGGQHFLLLSGCPLAVRVAGTLALTSENLEKKVRELDPWSAGRLASGSSLANLEPLLPQEEA